MLKRTTGKLINMFKWLKEHRPFRRKPVSVEPTQLNTVEDLFAHYGVDDPCEFGRMMYKYTSCGPWTAFLLRAPVEHPGWNGTPKNSLYYEDFRRYPELCEHAHEIVGVQFGSIVEGTDAEAVPVTVEFPCTDDDIDAAIQDVDTQCTDIWNETHGCPHCYHDGDEDVWEKSGENPVNPDCKECKGHGTVI